MTWGLNASISHCIERMCDKCYRWCADLDGDHSAIKSKSKCVQRVWYQACASETADTFGLIILCKTFDYLTLILIVNEIKLWLCTWLHFYSTQTLLINPTLLKATNSTCSLMSFPAPTNIKPVLNIKIWYIHSLCVWD